MKTARIFPPDVDSIPAARRFVLAAMGAVTRDLRDAVSVMVSELAMNAVQHARTPFQVTAEITGRTLRVEVTDSGGGTAEAQPLPPATSPHGRGLFIVDQLSDTWGARPAPPGRGNSIWFTIALTAAADSTPHQSVGTDPPPPAGTPPRPPAPPSPNPRMHRSHPERSPTPGQKSRPAGLLEARCHRALKASKFMPRHAGHICGWPVTRPGCSSIPASSGPPDRPRVLGPGPLVGCLESGWSDLRVGSTGGANGTSPRRRSSLGYEPYDDRLGRLRRLRALHLPAPTRGDRCRCLGSSHASRRVLLAIRLANAGALPFSAALGYLQIRRSGQLVQDCPLPLCVLGRYSILVGAWQLLFGVLAAGLAAVA